MRKFKLTVLLFFSALMLSAQTERPKLVVGLVVDQMRWDYLYYYYDKFGEGGLKRLVDEGYSFENTMINYVPTITAIGHSSIYTGSVPALTGITGNSFYVDGRRMYCCEDSTAKTVGSNTKAGMMSPRNMLASTMGDMLKIATDFKSKVIGVALKDRASILPAGHSADAAYWYDEEAGHFITSTYYMNELPKWVKEFNEKNNTKPGFDIKTSNLGVTMTFKMAEAALENENLGSDEITDLLAVSISSTDAIGHEYGTRGKENHDVYMQLDKDMAHFFKMLDEKVGRNNYLLFLTADHGAAHNPNFLKSHKIPSGGWESRSVRTKLNEHLKETFKTTSNLVVGISSYKVYLNHKNIEAAGLKLRKVKKEAMDFLRKDDKVLYVVDFERAAQAPIPQLIRERIVNGYNPERSGDIFVVTKAGYIDAPDRSDYIGTSHSAWNPYDSHIPLVFMGWKTKKGSTSVPCSIVDIAPTICSMLRIQMPNSCIGNALMVF